MPADPRHRKRALRVELRELRRQRTARDQDAATLAITDHLRSLATGVGAKSVAAYLPSTDEPNIRPFIDWAIAAGVTVLMPVSRDDGLLDWAVTDGLHEQEGAHGMPEPVGELLGPIAINDVDLILVPASAVDRTGMRMGWGMGYFDRTLGSMERCPPVYAVIFDNELLDSVPSEVHDKRVDGVVTPSAIVTF
ncbi:5-formyltetrahydrofolate cyclo-ligase [Marisediminicola senii]|uniref:5-formyltetrahydrofolate cyclo-ligase n=1 Tax=Marisediminicola senii TaxID=2711233 RepID=UPI0013EBC74E|nr:5-formyltetrahydrofolate cyclo-ligase [Marisediminicola senii]